MFRGNQELCLKIKESHIATMAKYMAEFEDVYEISQVLAARKRKK